MRTVAGAPGGGIDRWALRGGVDGRALGGGTVRSASGGGTVRRARRRLVTLALALGLSLAGCSGIPTDGPVVSWDRPGPAPGEGDIAVQAQGPAQGAQPAAIIDGFIVAMAEYEPGYSTARQFLTEQASAKWRSNTVNIYADLAGLTMAGESSARITAQLVGQLSPGGVYTAATGATSTLDFSLTQNADGEWRIASLPPDLGVVVTRARFNSAYQRVDTFYFDDQSSVLVPDTRYLPRGRWLRQLLEALLAGPSSRVAAITDASPVVSVALAPDVDPTLDATGVVTIPLDGGAGVLSRTAATRLAVQCAATLRQVSGVTGVRLTVDGQALPVDGQVGDGVLPLTGVAGYDPFLGAGQDAPLWGVRDGLVVRLSGGTWPGDLGTTVRSMTALAVREDRAGSPGGALAVVTATGLTLGRGGEPPQDIVTAEGLVRPQFDRDGRLWAVAPSGDGGSQVWLVTADGVTQPAAPALAGRSVVAFRIAPDGRRVAFVVDTVVDGQPRRQLGLAQVRHAGDGQVWLDGWRDVPVVVDGADLDAIADVAWVGPSTLDVLGTSRGNSVNAVFTVGLDGVEPPEEIGRPSDAPLVTLATTPGGPLVVVLQDGHAYRWVDAHTWQLLGTRLAAVAYPT